MCWLCLFHHHLLAVDDVDALRRLAHTLAGEVVDGSVAGIRVGNHAGHVFRTIHALSLRVALEVSFL